MATQNKLLILDDEDDLLELFREMLSRLPSKPEIHTANTGARALALLESEPFTMLLTDLKMPNIDGFQVLTVARRKYPQLKTVVVSGINDEQYRNRAYALGIDLYLEKPKSNQDVTLFLDCIEALLNQEDGGGFRGVQSKGLSDIIQMECLSQNSAVLKIINGPMEGKIWIHDGNVIDAAVGDLTGEAAFKKIFAWKSGHFENLPGEPGRQRVIQNSYQGLLLDCAQSQDESESGEARPSEDASQPAAEKSSPLAVIGRVKGVEFAISVKADDAKKFEQWGADNPEQMAAWCQKNMHAFRALGEKLKAGPLNQVVGVGVQRHLAVVSREQNDLCVGFQRAMTTEQIRNSIKDILIQWAS